MRKTNAKGLLKWGNCFFQGDKFDDDAGEARVRHASARFQV